MVRKDDATEHKTWKERLAEGSAPTSFNDQRGGGVGHYIPEPIEALKKRK